MDEFARMMSMEGVRPLDTSGNKFRRVVNRPSPVPSQPSGPPSNWSRAAMHGLPENVREQRLRQLWSALPARSALDDVAGQPVFYRMEGRSHCRLRQERHLCSAPQIVNRCAL